MTECIIWTKAATTGYGMTWDGERTQLVHRQVLLADGVDLTGLEVHHLCGVRLCYNKEHLQPMNPRAHRELHSGITDKRCRHGHEDRIALNNRGTRFCQDCAKAAKTRWKDKQHGK